MARFSRSAGRSDVGRVRPHNEDAFLCDEEIGLYVVADGMGGAAAGEVAAAEAIDQIHGMVRRNLHVLEELRADAASEQTRGAVRRLLESAVQAATYMVFGLAEQDPTQRGMGTTISLLLLSSGRAFLAQVGDSRIYHSRGQRIVQLTEDHTLVNLQVKMGVLSAEEAKTAKHGNVITRAVGIHDYVQVDTFDVQAIPGDRFILCSDGLCGYVPTAEEFLPYLAQPELDVCARSLIDLANSRGGKDNITVVVIEALQGQVVH